MNKKRLFIERNKKSTKKQGPFTLSNCTRQLKGISHKYEYKNNIHNCNFCNAKINTVRYKSGHITHSTFKNATIKNTDFICVNLKHNRFYNTQFHDCVFFGCNFENSNFKNSVFQNVYFIQCKLSNVKNFKPSETTHFINKYPELTPCVGLINTLKSIALIPTLETYKILTISSSKINIWMLALVLTNYTENELIAFFNKISKTNRVQFYTVHDYIYTLQKYYKR